MSFLLWALIPLFAHSAIAAPRSSTLLKRGWGYECTGQILPPGTWYAATVQTWHIFAGVEDNDRATGCYWDTQAAAQSDLEDVCRLRSDASNGCHWNTLAFKIKTVPPSPPCLPVRPAEPAPAQGCYQAKDSCGGPVCVGQSDQWCLTTGKAQYGCGWVETRPFQPLSQYHDGCNSKHKSRSPECVAAMHRYCMYSLPYPIGIPQEVSPTSNALAFLCTSSNFYDNVGFGSIPGCSGGRGQSPDCYASVKNYCDDIGKGGVGIVQEAVSDKAGVACVPDSTYHAVKMTVLQGKHPGCNSPSKGQNPDCASAVHQYCSDNGFGQGGVVSQLGIDEVAVGCISVGKYQEVRI